MGLEIEGKLGGKVGVGVFFKIAMNNSVAGFG